MDRFEIAAALRELAMLVSLSGENRYKVAAYERGAEALEVLEEELDVLIAADRLTEVPNIGRSLASVIRELHQTGESQYLERLRNEIPRGVVELSKIEGLALSKVQALYAGLGVDSLESLREAIDSGRVLSVKGFGPKTVEKLKETIARHEKNRGRMRLLDALETAERVTRLVRGDPLVAEVSVAGELRRWHEVVGGIELVAASSDPAATMARFQKISGGALGSLLAVPPQKYGPALIIRTGAPEHVAELEARARERGLSLGSIDGATEEEIYRRLGLSPIAPELREGRGEIAAAAEKDISSELISTADIRGMVHCHTRYSDGRGTIEEMAAAADELGIEYLTITDHSPSAFYARGVELERLKQQWDEIAEVQSRVKVKLLRGTESDILADGGLDYPDEILAQMDIVIASIHSRFKMDEDAMTERIIRAMKHPMFKIWGHALGRLILAREPFACRMEEILDVVADQRAALEISGDPNRLELEPKWIAKARERGIPFVVSVDAHSTRALKYVELGTHIARRGGVTKQEALNTLPFAEFLNIVRPAA